MSELRLQLHYLFVEDGNVFGEFLHSVPAERELFHFVVFGWIQTTSSVKTNIMNVSVLEKARCQTTTTYLERSSFNR